MVDLAIPSWDDTYPRAAELRADTQAMAVAVAESLVSTLPAGAVRGIYFKGSAAKPWSSPIDYVPDLSDVDVHAWYADNALAEVRALLVDLPGGIARHRMVEAAFARLRPSPAHVPRVQVMELNALAELDDYASSPVSTVIVMHGEPYPEHDRMEPAASVAARQLVEVADEALIQKLTGDLVERPGAHLFLLLRQLSWRVSPIASLVMAASGHDFDMAWTSNRTQLVQALAAEQPEVARLLVNYYSRAWDAYQSGWSDGAAGRDAFAAAVEVLHLAREVGETVRRPEVEAVDRSS